MDAQKAQNSELPKAPPAPIISGDFGNKNNFYSQPPPNLANFNNAPAYMNYVQQYAQNRMQQQQMENNNSGFFRPGLPHFNQPSPSLFNKPIRFNINKQGTKVNPMMRQQQPQYNSNNNINNNSPFNQQQQNINQSVNAFQNNSAKKRKNKKKNKNKGNNANEGFTIGNLFDQPPLPPSSFSRPPPPVQPPPLPFVQCQSPQSILSQIKSDSSLSSASSVNIDKSSLAVDSTCSIPSPSSTTSKDSSATNPAMEWPESLYNYVARCYMKCQTPLDKDLCEITLKGKITMAANRSELFNKDWDNEPMPHLHSDRLQQQQQQPLIPLQSPTNNLFAKNKNIVTGHLAQYQNQSKKQQQQQLLSRKSPARKRKTSSSSRSRSKSPVKRRRSSDDDEKYSSKPANVSKASKKRAKKEKMQSAFYTKFGAGGISGGVDSWDSERLKKRADRFKKSMNAVKAPAHNLSSAIKKRLSMPSAYNPIVDDSMGSDELEDFLNFHIVGTCRDLEKSFLRLTKAPDASEVRPVEVLIYSLTNVKDKWIEKQDYYYACDQLKSIRQDLTVQGIRDSFTSKVYETHAR